MRGLLDRLGAALLEGDGFGSGNDLVRPYAARGAKAHSASAQGRIAASAHEQFDARASVHGSTAGVFELCGVYA